MNAALEKARELGRQEGYFNPGQFENEWNVEENRTWLGPEILDQLPEGVVPMRWSWASEPAARWWASDRPSVPSTRTSSCSPWSPPSRRRSCVGEIGEHLIEGIADGFISGIFARHEQLVDITLTADSEEAVGNHEGSSKTVRSLRRAF